MKYEEYKKLTPEQKEEYDYRFRYQNNYPGGAFLWLFIIGMLIVVIQSMSVVIFLTPELEHYIPQLSAIIYGGGRYMQVFFIIGMASIIMQMIDSLITSRAERKWRKSLCQTT